MMIRMLEAALRDAKEGKIEEALILTYTPEGQIVTYAMGQTNAQMVYTFEAAKLSVLAGATYEETDYSDDEKED